VFHKAYETTEAPPNLGVTSIALPSESTFGEISNRERMEADAI
jgi:hypothetical protein